MISFRELGRQLDVSDMAVRKAVKSGRLSVSVARDDRAKPIGIADLELAKREWAEGSRKGATAANDRREPSSQGSQDANHGAHVTTLADAHRKLTLERERKVRLENDISEARMVSVDKVAKEAFEATRTIREAVLNVPSRIAGEVAAETDAAKVYVLLDLALRAALNASADRMLEGVVG